jgi:hypothetical protein
MNKSSQAIHVIYNSVNITEVTKKKRKEIIPVLRRNFPETDSSSQ